MFEVTFWPILAAGIANLVLGMVWYHPKVFGTAWMAGAGITPEQAERGKRRMPVMAILATLAAMLLAYVLSHLAVELGVFDWVGAVVVAFWCWAGFVAPVLLGSVLWEQKSLTYYAINAGYWLVSFIAIATILALMA
ncbi:MAG TPA: DUF1761 domain-containing protein [Candidatus Paceibacterota bacterium]|nr:DUF1761 domain-containing protein [Candidatus Paceibacterota bacterium]